MTNSSMIWKNKKAILMTAVFCFLPLFANAATLGEVKNFYVDPVYDINARQNVSSQLVLETSRLYFYVDSILWNGFSSSVKNEIINNLSLSGDEFSNKIYPTLTSNYGSEWNPGIDNDPKITIVFHQLKRGAGGYFNSGNEYSKLEVPVSNEREMIYLNSDYLTSRLIKRLLVHEFTHLITFNQKEKINNVEEEVWLNEARAEYAITLCGYDNPYQGSNLQKRVVEFLKNPNDSLTDWQGVSSDYGVLNIFTQYIVDQYGVRILNNSLSSKYRGIESINYALKQNGIKEDFSQIFSNWTIASFINDCSLGTRYCYKNVNLKNLKVIPSVEFLSLSENSTMTINYFSKSWAGYWNKISNVKGNLEFNFSGNTNGNFNVSYILCDKANKCEVASMILDRNQGGNIGIKNFDLNYSSFIIISFGKTMDDRSLNFSLEAKSEAVANATSEDSKLLAQIDELKRKISEIQALLGSRNKGNNCGKITNILYFGLVNNADVLCLQQFLKNQGSEIYPEGLVTGNFYSKTKIAVIKFQEKYASEILIPVGLLKGTGIVGVKTRDKINQLISL